MRILHTADWHLGKRLEQSERTDEHQAFLDWLIHTLQAENIEVLIIAGDIFDTGSPSNTAFEQYYRFLRQVKDTCCREVIIIGGNHDSISTLNAPQALLKYFNVHIIGGVPEDFNDQIIEICDADGFLELVVCAVPFLRDKDIRLSVSGESVEERETRIKQGICNHYHQFVPLISQYKLRNIPVVATGHLFAAGSSTSESEKEIHVGNLGQVGGDQFPVDFNYVALGHIHKPQLVNQMNHIRYSGSPIPLSFSETADRKQVIIIDFKGAEITALRELEIPCTRKLIRIKGDFEKVKSKLMALEDPETLFPCWIEVQVQTEKVIYDLEEQLNALIVHQPFIERIFTRQQRIRPALNLDEQSTETMTLADLDPKTVFLKKCASEYPEEDQSTLLFTFNEVLELMSQNERDA
ncbi:exonuclease SbcCD subunit D C-terminal domain-containing protein [Pedobacter sp. AW31-3R]|uniref:exonuclease SbcCD subunit D C-terminal domain-containing protein n=1 Tax=Pedobacter sp. AW31-3R TaxID=3445781 RepID=UPI003FA090D9